MATKLYVGNLTFETTEDNLRELFGKFGVVSTAALIMDRLSGRSKGFGFVEMDNDEEAQKAISELNGKEYNGREIVVNVARPREERPRRDFSGGGAGGGYNR